MFSSSWLIAGCSLALIIQSAQAISCPYTYNSILNGCYKVNNGTNVSWTGASQYCTNDSHAIVSNKTGFVTHLLAFESAIETTSLVYWMKAWGIRGDFWTDGVASSFTWSWSGQAISWYFYTSDQMIFGNGTNYRLVYSANTSGYVIADELDQKPTHFICEYQERCNANNSCLNNATCFLNVGRELCVCAPGYTGTICDQEIDECLSSPCQHGGACSDAVNNYTCDCSSTFFGGPNCDTANPDPTQSQRSAAFWSVFGVVCSMVALLTISDLPWHEIARTVGCPWFHLKCCSHQNDEDEDFDEHQFRLAESPTSPEQNLVTMSKTSTKGQNYHVMNTVWNPEQLRAESNNTLTSQPSNGFRSPDQQTTPNNVLIQSFTAAVIEKQKQKQLENKRVYAVDIAENREKSGNATDTMVSWTQQLQEQLKGKPARESSASSSKQLILPLSNVVD